MVSDSLITFKLLIVCCLLPLSVFFLCLSSLSLGCIFFAFPGALQIENTEETDQGKYECVASNVEGVRYSSPANLYVRGREQPGRGAHQKQAIRDARLVT